MVSQLLQHCNFHQIAMWKDFHDNRWELTAYTVYTAHTEACKDR